VVTTALNVPGPAACARLRDWGAAIAKIEPPAGDPLATYAPAWYDELHRGIEVLRLDLKEPAGRSRMRERLAGADILVTAQRPAALERMGLDPASLKPHERLVHVAITGHAAPDEDLPGHDLTYLAACGLVVPPALPATLLADMAGAERAVSTALALVLGRMRSNATRAAAVPLADAARALAQPRRAGLTRVGAPLGGGLAGYNLYATRSGWIAVAALEPRFEEGLARALGMARLEELALREHFGQRTAEEWETWARERDLPIVAVRDPFDPS